MRKVAVASYATSNFVRNINSSIFELACQPCIEILKDSSLGREEIDAVLFSSCSTEQYSSAIISEMLGIKPKVAYRMDNLCNSGTNTIVSGMSYIAAGLCDSVLVVGAEKADSKANRLEWDITRGSFISPVYWAALFAKAHMQKYGTTEEQMAMVSVKNRNNAIKNPSALFRKPVTLEDVLSSRKIADPIKLLDCCSTCNGSSALLLLSENKAKKLCENPVWIKGVGQRTNSASFSKTAYDLSSISAAKNAARDAFKMASLKPKEIDIAEVHDAFSILEILAYEDLEFVDKGEGGKFVEQDQLSINPRGGILGCGHPVGATGVAQTAEIVKQLTGNAGQRQIKHCKNGLVHNLAAAGTSATIIILGVN